MNYIKDCESKLSDYNKINDIIMILKKRINKVALAGCPKEISAIDLQKLGKVNFKNDTLNEMIEVIHLKNRIEVLRDEKELINFVLEKIRKESKELYDFLNLRYIKNFSLDKIAEKLGYSENSKRTLYSIKERALEIFCLYYWGEK